ncbi:MAG: VOC family protein [Saprospiraceae bacterium]|nr:VOC family protein [Saprospiraceae bacterium]
MLSAIHPKIPMRDKTKTREYYINKLEFRDIGNQDYDGYLMLKKDNVEIHFFEFKDLDPAENYGQVYIRTSDIDGLYKSMQENNVIIHPGAPLQVKPWGQKEFSLLDPDNNLLTFGQDL